MKSRRLLISLIILFSLPVIAYGGPFDLVKNKIDFLKNKIDGGKDVQKVDMNVLTARSGALMLKVALANIAFGEAVVEIQKAVGNAAEAEKLKEVIEAVKAEKKDPEKIKTCAATINNAVESLNKTDLKSQVNLADARICIGKSLLKFGSGILVDTTAIDEARKLLGESTDALKAVQASPVQYGPSALANVQGVIAASKFVVETIPTQVKSCQEFNGKLIEYAKTNQLPIPSADDVTKYANNEMEKG